METVSGAFFFHATGTFRQLVISSLAKPFPSRLMTRKVLDHLLIATVLLQMYHSDANSKTMLGKVAPQRKQGTHYITTDLRPLILIGLSMYH